MVARINRCTGETFLLADNKGNPVIGIKDDDAAWKKYPMAE